MNVRAFVPALVFAPLLAQAQAQRSVDHGDPDATAPFVSVWIPGTWNFHYGQWVPVRFEVSDAAHVAVFRVDGSGHLSVLWPERNLMQTAARAGREYRVLGRSNYGAFPADYQLGQGMVIAIASSDPIDLSAFRRYRNDESYYRYVSGQTRYVGGVKNVVNRLADEILYAVDSPFDYDVAFYSSSGRGVYSSAYCGYGLAGYPGWHRPSLYSSAWRFYSAYLAGWSSLGGWDDCYYGAYIRSAWGYCSAWSAFYGVFDSGWCRFGNPFWPGGFGPGTGPAPRQQANIGMIDTVIARPVAFDRKAEPAIPTGSGTTHIVVMEPVREPPNVTYWLPDDDGGAISLPSRYRRQTSEPSRGGGGGGGGINTRDEGFTRGPGSGIRVGDPSRENPPERSPGSALMPPVREAPRPVVWRDDAQDRGSSYTGAQRWERPTYPGTPSRSGNGGTGGASGRVDRGHSSAGSTSPSPGAAVMPPRTDATVTKTSGGAKTSDSKTTGERKPH